MKKKLLDIQPAGARGRTTRLPKARRLTVDLMRLSVKTPAVADLRHASIQRLANVRANCEVRISWPVLFFKAYAIVAARTPELRRVYIPLPWGRLYEHPEPVGRMTVPRTLDGVEGVFLSHTTSPHQRTLADLQAELYSMIHDDFEDNEQLSRLNHFAGFPGWLRRILWSTMNWAGEWRTRWLGTYTLTTVSKFGAVIVTPPVFANSTLSFGPVDASGAVEMILAYDHRVTDGAVSARALAELEDVLENEIADELESYDRSQRRTE